MLRCLLVTALGASCFASAHALAATPSAKPELEFHGLRNDRAKAAGELKPRAEHPDLPTVRVELRAHYHDDGRISYACDQNHSADTPRDDRAPTEPQQ